MLSFLKHQNWFSVSILFPLLFGDFPFTELGEAELREVVAARLGPNGEAVLRNLINTGKAQLFLVNEGSHNEAAYVRIKKLPMGVRNMHES